MIDNTLTISIHAPREGGDGIRIYPLSLSCISIHAPREGGDFVAKVSSVDNWNFNPRPREGGDQGLPGQRIE